MNRFVKIFFFFIALTVFWGCKETVVINQNSTEKEIILKLAKSNNSVIIAQIPNSLEIDNNSLLQKAFVQIEFNYNNNPYDRKYGISLFEKKANKLISVSTRGKKNILGKSQLKYIYYTYHFIDSSKVTQKQFKPYIEKMLVENKDTLHIGTVSEFKIKHKELFEKLTKGDSISIQFLDNGKLGERITVPVEW